MHLLTYNCLVKNVNKVNHRMIFEVVYHKMSWNIPSEYSRRFKTIFKEFHRIYLYVQISQIRDITDRRLNDAISAPFPV